MMAGSLCARAGAASAMTVGDRVVLYHRRSRTSVVLNPTGAWLWNELSQPKSVDELVKKLNARFPAVSPDQAARDVDAFVSDMVKHDLLSLTA
jgi:hypothetical protein